MPARSRAFFVCSIFRTFTCHLLKMRGKTISLSCIAAARMCGTVMIMLLLCRAGTAQTLPFREYSPDDGLPRMENARYMQDSRGYFWITSRNGLTLFDGHSFTTFMHKE